jgi:hypothetical protein
MSLIYRILRQIRLHSVHSFISNVGHDRWKDDRYGAGRAILATRAAMPTLVGVANFHPPVLRVKVNDVQGTAILTRSTLLTKLRINFRRHMPCLIPSWKFKARWPRSPARAEILMAPFILR